MQTPAPSDGGLLDWLYSAQMFGIKLGLENIRRLLAQAGNPENQLAIIHVAGTNGKGSVCALIDAILRAAGLRSGLFTSPHLVDFRERIRVGGQKIDPAELEAGLARLKRWADEARLKPTFFELNTALALDHFARSGCEAVVLETGMGGRLDATNVVTPRVSVLTSIALDHTQWLGGTLELVAAEKAGIIKQGVPVCSAPQVPEVRQVITETASAHHAPLHFITEPWPGSVGLPGSHQKLHAALAVAALRAGTFPVTNDHIRAGLAQVVWPGRFQVVEDRYVLDGGHNPHAARRLTETWREVYGERRTPIIFGALEDKDIPGMVETLDTIASEFLYVPVSNPRAVDPDSYPLPPSTKVRIFRSLNEALQATDQALITGSLFLVGEAMSVLGVDT